MAGLVVGTFTGISERRALSLNLDSILLAYLGPIVGQNYQRIPR